MAERAYLDQSDGLQKEDIPQGYEEYLLLLQQRNRLLKKLKTKDKKQKDLEQREKGFSLYINGANVDLKLGKADGHKTPRKAKTADVESSNRDELALEEAAAFESDSRAWTAPSKQARRGWGKSPSQIKIKTEKGDKVELKTGRVTGKYSEDFEMYQSMLEEQLAEEDGSEDDNESNQIEIEVEETSPNDRSPSGDKHTDTEDEESEEVIDETEDKMTLTINDVKALRKSIENNREIAESIRSIREQIDRNDQAETDTDDDIEEELETLKDSREIDPSELPQLGRTFPKESSDGQKSTKAKEKLIVDRAPKESADVRSSIGTTTRAEPIVLQAEFEDKPKEMISAARKSRPLSANRKARRDDFIPVDKSSEDIAKAIMEENRNIDISGVGAKIKQDMERESKSAPSQDKKVEDPTESAPRPSSIATASVDDALIVSIVERVKQMDGRQQLRLLSFLSKVEELDVTEDDIASFFDETKPQTKVASTKTATTKAPDGSAIGPLFEKKPEKPTSPKGVKATAIKGKISLDEKDGQNESETVDVCLEISSNWGHPEIVGITEVEFFDDDNKQIRLKAEQVEMTTDQICYTPTRNLINGKTKTTKERYMWNCQMKKDDPIQLVFHIPVGKITSRKSSYGISEIAIWNYNKSLYDLNIGVKDARVIIDGEVVWEGVIEKGCGNQVFDYSKIVRLYEETSSESLKEPLVESGERCKTATLVRDPSEVVNLPRVDMPLESPRNSKDVAAVKSYNDNHETSSKGRASSAEDPGPQSPNLERLKSSEVSSSTDSAVLSSRSFSTPNLSSNADQSTPSDPCERDYSLTPTMSRKHSHGPNNVKDRAGGLDKKPLWLPGNDDPSKESGPIKADKDIITNTKPHSRPNSGRRAVKSTPEGSRESTPTRTASAGRRKGMTRTNAEEDIEADARDELAGLLSKKPNQKRPTSGRRSTADIENKKTETLEQELTGRRRFREMVDIDLEKSLNSINKFEHSHLGRITSNLDLEKGGDALDALIKPAARYDETDGSGNSLDDTLKAEELARISFEIPTLPKGRSLVLNLKSTWGDRHYIGLNGVEVFTDSGELATVKEISADPADINILAEYDQDPRVVTNLIDGVYMTRDDLHLWLTPFAPGGNHFVKITFEKPVTIAMLRIWNYNKSRIHSTRGAKDVEVSLDNEMIFKGEIARASGVLSKESEPYGDIILFTTDEDILEEVAKNDFTFEYDIVEEEEKLMQSVERDRPKTADQGEIIEILERPYTCPKSRQDVSRPLRQEVIHQVPMDQVREMDYTGKVMKLNFIQTWGDLYYLGLTGIQILGEDYEPLDIDINWMDASPRDLNDLEDYDDDDRTLDKLLDGENVTNSDEHMWMIPFAEGEDHIVTISFPEKQLFTGIRIWNYNKNAEDTYRGAKAVQLFIDDKEVSPENGFLLRKGPGHCHFDFAQDILFNQDDDSQNRKERSRRGNRGTPDCENVFLPTGFVFQIRLFSTWGDPYYIGLNGLEFYDEHGEKILLDENNVTAYPHSVNVLEGVENDIRTPDKLVDGINDTYDASHMWIAPAYPGLVNVIYIVFDSPISLSMVKLWNYSKTGPRGVRQFAILVDDLLVYSGILPQVTHHTRAILPGLELPVPHHTILFTDDEEIIHSEPKNLLSAVSMSVDQDVQMTNDNSIVNPYTSPSSAGKTIDPANRPMTSVTYIKSRR